MGSTNRGPAGKSVLIIEPVTKHWTTVEPLVALFATRGWNVSVVAPEALNNTLRGRLPHLLTVRYCDIRRPSTEVVNHQDDVVIAANRLFYEKIPVLTARAVVRLALSQRWRRALLSSLGSRSLFIVTAHFVDGTSAYPGDATRVPVLGRAERDLWDRACSRLDGLNVYTSLVKDRAQALIPKPVLVAPNALFDAGSNPLKSAPSDRLMVVVPGRIDLRRRNYEWISRIGPALRGRLSLVLLGRPQSPAEREVVNRFEALGFPQPLALSERFIGQADFDAHMRQADLLLAPLTRLESPDRAVDRNLGAFFDAVRYGKSLLVPSHAPVAPELRDSVVAFTDHDHLAELLTTFAGDSDARLETATRAHANSARFCLDRMTYVKEVTELLYARTS